MSKLGDQTYFVDILDYIFSVVLLLSSLAIRDCSLPENGKRFSVILNPNRDFVVLIYYFTMVWSFILYADWFSLMLLMFDQKCCLVFFFSGLIPRLLGDVLSLWICNLLAHLLNTYAIDDSVCPFFFHTARCCWRTRSPWNTRVMQHTSRAVVAGERTEHIC